MIAFCVLVQQSTSYALACALRDKHHCTARKYSCCFGLYSLIKRRIPISLPVVRSFNKLREILAIEHKLPVTAIDDYVTIHAGDAKTLSILEERYSVLWMMESPSILCIPRWGLSTAPVLSHPATRVYRPYNLRIRHIGLFSTVDQLAMQGV